MGKTYFFLLEPEPTRLKFALYKNETSNEDDITDEGAKKEKMAKRKEKRLSFFSAPLSP